MKKTLIIVAVAILVLALVLSLAKNEIVKISVEKGVELVTGLRLRIQSMNVGVIKTLVGIKNLQLYNPKGFKDKIMLDMPEIYVEYDLPAIISGDIHLPEMRIDLKEFVVIKNEKGELNLNSLKVVKSEKEGKKAAQEEKGKMPEIRIDKLQLKIGKAVYKDYSKGGEPQVQEFNVNLNESYENITNPNALVGLIVTKALMNTTISKLANFDLGAMEDVAAKTLSTAQSAATEAVAKTAAVVEGTGKLMGPQAERVTETAAKGAEEVVKGTGDAIKGLFGSKEE